MKKDEICLCRDLHILQSLKVQGLLLWLSAQHNQPDWLLPELKVGKRVPVFSDKYCNSSL
jgi:hypothetical protein